MTKYLELDHIGIILKEEFMEPFGLSMNALAKAINVPANRIHGIIHGIRGMSADTDLRLTRYFGLSQGFFLRMQNRYEMIMAKRELGDNLNKIIPLRREDLSRKTIKHDNPDFYISSNKRNHKPTAKEKFL